MCRNWLRYIYSSDCAGPVHMTPIDQYLMGFRGIMVTIFSSKPLIGNNSFHWLEVGIELSFL